jgi:hypothetical protein
MIEKMTIKRQSEINRKEHIVDWSAVVHRCPICGGCENAMIGFFQKRHKVCRESKRGKEFSWTDESKYAKVRI